MSRWRELDMEQRIEAILHDVPCHDPCRDFVKPFISAYQLACLFRRRHRGAFNSLNMPLGGEGSGGRTFSGYLAQELARVIRNSETTPIEGGWYYSNRILTFDCDGEEVRATATLLSVFRLRECLDHRTA